MWKGSTRPIVYDSIYGGEYIAIINRKRKRYGSRIHDQTLVVTSYRIYGCVLRKTQWYKPKMPRSQPLLANTQKISFDP